jgi:hypothetical protein
VKNKRPGERRCNLWNKKGERNRFQKCESRKILEKGEKNQRSGLTFSSGRIILFL